MKLYQLINQYVSYRKALGEKFKTNETYLKAFCTAIGAKTTIKSVKKEMVQQFLYGKSEMVTTGWFVKHSALLGLYQYAISRNYVTQIPLPKTLPKRPQAVIPKNSRL